MSPRKTTPKIIGASLAGLALLGGLAVAGTAVASAQPAPTSAHSATSTTSGTDTTGQNGEQGGVTGTLKAPAETPGQSEQEQGAALQAIAKVTRADAEKAALAAVPGTVTSSTLGDENGWVIFEVTVKDAKGASTEVKVDAGNGRVLAHEAADAKGSEANEPAGQKDGPEGAETTGAETQGAQAQSAPAN